MDKYALIVVAVLVVLTVVAIVVAGFGGDSTPVHTIPMY